MIHEHNEVKSPISCCGWKIKKNPIINYSTDFDPYLFNTNIKNNKLVDIVGCNSLLLERKYFTQNEWNDNYMSFNFVMGIAVIIVAFIFFKWLKKGFVPWILIVSIVGAVAIAWILRHPANMQAILGTMNPAHLQETAKAAEIRLTREEWYRLYLASGKFLP